MITAHLSGNIISSNSQEAHSLHAKSYFGEPKEDKIQYMLIEALYLVKTNRMEILSKGKSLSEEKLQSKFQKLDKKFSLKYPVFENLRKKGYIVKTALKFGADFRVYEPGKKPGSEHAKWLVFVESEAKKMDWHEFSARNRVAHSTKKNLLLAIVDEEGDVTYYEVSWLRP